MVRTRGNRQTGRVEDQREWQEQYRRVHVFNRVRRTLARYRINNFIQQRRNNQRNFGFDDNNDYEPPHEDHPRPRRVNTNPDKYNDDDECHRHRKPDRTRKTVRVREYVRRPE